MVAVDQTEIRVFSLWAIHSPINLSMGGARIASSPVSYPVHNVNFLLAEKVTGIECPHGAMGDSRIRNLSALLIPFGDARKVYLHQSFFL